MRIPLAMVASRRFSTWILTCFFLSGATSLVYEILWTRMLVQVIGGAPFAVSTILTVFMLGLGLGSYLAGGRIDRVTDPGRLLRAYGVLEIAIGVYCLLIPLLLAACRPVFGLLYNGLYDQFLLYVFLTFLCCSALLLVPAVCMGATLPILCRFYITGLAQLGTRAGRLYGLNTVGAALGSLVCGFWLIRVFGVLGTLYLAVAVNLLIGLSCMALSKWSSNRDSVATPEAEDATTAPHKHAEPATAPHTVPVMFLFAVSGFCSMAYEVIWTKLLALLVGPTTYSFTIVLVTFITCLALGSIIFGWVADRVARPLSVLVATQVVAALSALVVSQILGTSQFFFAKLIYHFQDNFLASSFASGGVLFVLMLAPTLCLGAAFPLVGKLCTPALERLGKSIGVAYAINTVGAVLGSFCAGFLLVPLLGKEQSLRWVCGLQLVVPLLLGGYLLLRDKKASWGLVVASAAAIIGLVLTGYYPKWDRQMLSTGKYHRFGEVEVELKTATWSEALLQGSNILRRYRRGELVHYGDGIGGFTTVSKFPGPFGDTEFAMANSGKPDASSRGDMETQTLLAHVPMLFHPGAKSVMVVGLASGITAGEVLHYPVERLDVVEISPEVVEASKHFAPWNNDVLRNPHTQLIIQDARAHLLLTETKYDVVISEPSNPWMAGLAALFTQEFFATVKGRLNQDGIFCQWLHAYQMDWETFALVGRTFAAVFDNSLLLVNRPSTESADFLLVGFNGAGFNKTEGLSLENAGRNLPYLHKSRNIALSDARLLYRLVVSEDLQKTFESGPTNTDNHPRLEFEAPRLMHRDENDIREPLRARRSIRPATGEVARQVGADVDLQIDFAAFALSVYEPFAEMVDLFGASPAQVQRYNKLLEEYCAENAIAYSILDKDSARRCLGVQIATLERKIPAIEAKAAAHAYLGDLYRKVGDYEKAATHLGQSLTLEESADVHNQLGYLLLQRGGADAAMEHFTSALQLRPHHTKALANLGQAQLMQGKLDEAIEVLEQAVEWDPDLFDAHNNLGSAYARQQKYRQAIPHFKEALRIRPNLQQARNNLELAEKRLAEQEAGG